MWVSKKAWIELKARVYELEAKNDFTIYKLSGQHYSVTHSSLKEVFRLLINFLNIDFSVELQQPMKIICFQKEKKQESCCKNLSDEERLKKMNKGVL